jgi:hypothetical protein
MPPKETLNSPIQIQPRKKKFFNKKTIGLLILLLALAASIGAAIYFYLQTVQLKKTPQQVSAEQVKGVVAKVARLILLPQGETPTLAQVSDPNLLKSQSFFDKSQAGDEVLIFTNAKEAILYRPSSNMIINVAPINIGGNAPATNSNAPATNAPIKK